MTSDLRTTNGIAYDRAGPVGDLPILLIHAGIADRRMWDPQWSALTGTRDVIRLDLRGFGDSAVRPDGPLHHIDDVVGLLTELGVHRCHVVSASFGAGVAVEVCLSRPDLVASLLLSAPGGELTPEKTPDMAAFIEAEDAALELNDLDAAAAANVTWWVDGPGRDASAVDPTVREQVHQMQRRAFEITADWDDVEEFELDPPALDRLADISVPTLVLLGQGDLQAIHLTADRLSSDVPDCTRVDWEDVAHLPSMERPEAFLSLLQVWIADADRTTVES